MNESDLNIYETDSLSYHNFLTVYIALLGFGGS